MITRIIPYRKISLCSLLLALLAPVLLTAGCNDTHLKRSAGEPLRLEVAGARQHKGMWLVKFKGYDNINDVQSFRDHELMVTEDEQQPLEEGQYYYHQIIGLTVKTLEGRELGVIKEILSPGANDVWVVKRAGQSDLLLPVIDDVVKNVDLDKGEVDVELMEGLE